MLSKMLVIVLEFKKSLYSEPKEYSRFCDMNLNNHIIYDFYL